MDLVGVLEGLLFVSGDEGLTLKEISETLKVSEFESKELLQKLKQVYDSGNRGIKISYLGEAFKLTTKKEHKDYYEKLVTYKENILSQAQLEVLAIVAYNEPITRCEIDDLRGISSSYIVRKLMSKDLIKPCGKSNLPGRPNLYKTTRVFLDYFGLSSLNDLPKEENILLEDNQNLFKSKEID